MSSGDVASNAPLTIGPANVMHWNPYGMPGATPTSNSQVISIHNAVNALMPAGDIRGNYFMTGATWTIPGVVPPSGQVGTNQMTNSTLETVCAAELHFEQPESLHCVYAGPELLRLPCFHLAGDAEPYLRQRDYGVETFVLNSSL